MRGLVQGVRIVAVGAVLASGLAAASAQSVGAPGPTTDLAHGAMLFHGNYCGPGQRGVGLPPVDALDRACMHHDRCAPPADSGRLPTCGCNHRLRAEAAMVARSPRQPATLRSQAQAVADFSVLLPCR